MIKKEYPPQDAWMPDTFFSECPQCGNDIEFTDYDELEKYFDTPFECDCGAYFLIEKRENRV
jgi:hypothetical protein